MAKTTLRTTIPFLVAGLLAVGAAEAQQLQLSVSTNQSSYVVGDTIIYSLAVQNPGGIFETVDFYLGLLAPDGSFRFFTPSGFVPGYGWDLTSLAPIAVSIPLTEPFTIEAPNFFSEVVGVSTLLPGDYYFFLVAGTVITFLDGATTHDDLLVFRIVGQAAALFHSPEGNNYFYY